MRRTSTLAGLLGIVLLAFGIIGYALVSGGFAGLFILINVLGGIFALIVWVTSSWGTIGSMAGRRTTRYGANAAIYSIAFILLLVALNYLASVHHRQFDLTAQKVFSLSPQSTGVVKDLSKPLKFFGFVEGGRNPQAEALYQEYAYASPKVSFELVNPNQHPELAERFKVTTMNTTHIQYGGDGGQGTNVSDLTETAITNGIFKLVKAEAKTACFTMGEGEGDLNDKEGQSGFSEFQVALEGENYTVKKINLVTEAKVPDDCTVLAIVGPTRPLAPHAIDSINEFLDHGGRALVMVRPQRPDKSIDETALIKLLDDWGVVVGNNVVVDQVVRLFAGPTLGLNPLVNTYNPHPITTGFDKQTVFPMVRTVDFTTTPIPGLDVTALAKTSETSWAETDLAALFQKQAASFDQAADKKGPVSVAAAVEADLDKLKRGKGIARIVVIGDTEMADNQYLEQFFNRDFVMNSFDWLAGEAAAITIRPKTLRASRFNLTIQEFDVVFVLSVLLLPELLLLIGLAVWWERRN
jgi:ABC-type uncharacterized transport system involved in gliding motility auxiliary subunit